ncbi:MAG: hypothetical protein NW241_09455 [Bacteroidia bacterium]|nr:hypothetical protein [Bacteroidia bacterium]
MSLPAREYLQALLRDDRLEECLRILLDPAVAVPEPDRREANLMAGRLSSLAQQLRAGTLEAAAAATERNRIRAGLDGLAGGLPPQLQLSPSLERAEQRLRFRWALWMGLYLLAAGSVLAFLFQPQPGLRVEGDLLLDRLSYVQAGGSYNFGELDLASLRLTDFRQLRIDADSAALDPELDGTWEAAAPLDGPLLLEAVPGLPGLGINAGGPVRIASFTVPDAALVTIERIEHTQAAARVTVERMDSLQGEFSYLRRLDLQPEQVLVQGLPGHAEWAAPLGLRLSGPPDARRTLAFSSSPGLLRLEIFPRDSFSIEGSSLLVADLAFLRKHEEQATQTATTVLGGRLKIQELDRAPMQEIEIKESQRLTLSSRSQTEIRSLRLGPAGIRIDFSATLDRIETGEQYDLRNPSRAEWLWHNHRLLLTVLGTVLLGAIFFLPGPLKAGILGLLKQMGLLR